MALTEKQRRFVEYYDGNATQAALKAGYSQKTAHRIGSENMQKPDVVAAIKKRQPTKDAPHIASREERQAFWTRVLNDADETMGNRLKASELLGRSEADFVEKRQNEVTLKGNPMAEVAKIINDARGKNSIP